MRRAILIGLLFLFLCCGLGVGRHWLWDSLRPQLPRAPAINPHTSKSPFATRDGVTITLQPSGLQFDVPQDWVDWYNEFGNNFHLTGEELDRVGHGAGEWDDEYARVCNAILPFDRCAAHVGGEGWGKAGVSYADLQVRVYDLESPLETIEEGIAGQSTAEIERLIAGHVRVQRHDKDGWRQTVFSYGRFYYDYMDTAYVDIRLKRVEKGTIAFVFMHTSGDYKAIADILRTLRVQPSKL
jgi:hypothetical protein